MTQAPEITILPDPSTLNAAMRPWMPEVSRLNALILERDAQPPTPHDLKSQPPPTRATALALARPSDTSYLRG